MPYDFFPGPSRQLGAAIVLLLVVGCTSGTGLRGSRSSTDADHDAIAVRDASMGRDAEDGLHEASIREIRYCRGSTWDDDRGRVYHMCGGRPSVGWDCECNVAERPLADVYDGKEVDSVAATCAEAIDEVCGITAETATPCADLKYPSEEVAYCWPTIDASSGEVSKDTWDCRCAGETRLSNVSSTSCEAALATCMAPCSSAEGACEPTAVPGVFNCSCTSDGSSGKSWGPDCAPALTKACNEEYRCTIFGDECRPGPALNSWICDCKSYYHGERVVAGDDCAVARRNACDPRSVCNDWSGWCDDVSTPERGYRCTCLDGTTGFVPKRELFGGRGKCGHALDRICGTMEAPPGFECSKTTDDYIATCQLAGDEAQEGYMCECGYSCDAAGGSNGEFFEEEFCADALARKECDGCR